MKSNIDDKCGELFKDIKFKKVHRFVTFKVEQEKVVGIGRLRYLKLSGRGKATGRASWRHFPLKSPGCASSIWSTPATTA